MFSSVRERFHFIGCFGREVNLLIAHYSYSNLDPLDWPLFLKEDKATQAVIWSLFLSSLIFQDFLASL